MKYFISSIIALSLFFASCSEDSVKTYEVVEYVYFSDTTMNYSFAFDPDVTTKEIPVVIKLIGNQAEYERELTIVIDSTSSNVTAADYEIVSPKLRANMFSDTVHIRINKPQNPDEIGFIRFVIKGSQHFQPGPTINTRFSLTFSDILLQPDWWDTAMKKDYLGEYSEKKYRYFIIATGISDMTDMGSSEKRAYTLVFKKYISDHKLTEEDGSPMLLTIKE